ncbi:MAG: ABC transporter permease [Hyphomicrobiales bacterium]
MARGSRSGAGFLLALPLLVFLIAAVLWPLAALTRAALEGDGGRAMAAVLGAARTRVALANSLLLSASAAIGSLLVASVPAWVLARDEFAGKGTVRALLLLPLTFSGVMVGFLTLVMLGRAGLVPAVARLLTGAPLGAGAAYTLGGIFLSYLYFEVPRATLALEAAIRRLPPDLDRAARSLGAGPVARLARIHVPALAPAVRSTLALTFSASMGSFGVVLILARRLTVVPLDVYTELTGFGNDAAAGTLCLLLAAVTLAVDRLLAGARR